MKIECPECGFTWNEQTRAKICSGSRAGKRLRKLNKNKILLCDTLFGINKSKPLNVNDIQNTIYANDPIAGRWQKNDVIIPTGDWNYHHLQAELSLVVGAGIITMGTNVVERFNIDSQMYEADPVPRYWMDDEQKIRYSTVIKPNGGKIR